MEVEEKERKEERRQWGAAESEIAIKRQGARKEEVLGVHECKRYNRGEIVGADISPTGIFACMAVRCALP